MAVPLEVIFRNLEPSDAVSANVKEKVAKLERYVDKIIKCKVTIEAPHKHHHKGNLFQVRIDVTVPSGEMVVSRHPDKHHAHEDVYVAIRDAFEAIRRQIEEYNARRRGHVKHHLKNTEKGIEKGVE